MEIVENACDNSAIRVLELGLGTEGYEEQFANAIRYTLHVFASHFGGQMSEGAGALPSGHRRQSRTRARDFDKKFIGSSLATLRRSGVALDSVAHTSKFLDLQRI